MQQEIVTTIAMTNPETKLEIALDKGSQGEQIVELRRLAWGKGIGWYGQQTLRLDATEAEALFRALRQHRGKWSEKPARSSEKVIPFPTPADRQESSKRQTA